MADGPCADGWARCASPVQACGRHASSINCPPMTRLQPSIRTTLATLCLTWGAATAAVPVAQPQSSIRLERAGSFEALNARDFGASALAADFRGNGASGSTWIGADALDVPFVAIAGGADGQASSQVSASLYYRWSIVGTGAPGEAVPVTITTLGHVRGAVSADALRPDVRVDANMNGFNLLATTSFTTALADGTSDRRQYGVQTGIGSIPQPAGILLARFVDAGQSRPGGSDAEFGQASFSQTFSLMVRPNETNLIYMGASGSFGNYIYSETLSAQLHSIVPTASARWKFSAFVDPVITIDPAYAGRFSLAQSAIPMVPVPEASTWGLMLAGLGVVVGAARRRRRAT